MRILITNDDGISSPGLKLLASKAKKYGSVIVVAPKHEQSATAQAIRIRKGLEFEKVSDIVDGVDSYAIDSTPADCVRFAKYYLKDDFDIVFSGVNNGFNLGEDILYSGTVGAASEGVLTGAKAIAFSTMYNDLSEADKKFDEVMDFVFKSKLLDVSPLWNINFPLSSLGIKLTKQGHTYFDTVLELQGDLVYQRGRPRFDLDKYNENSDVKAILEKYISITPLTVDRTDKLVFEKIIKE